MLNRCFILALIIFYHRSVTAKKQHLSTVNQPLEYMFFVLCLYLYCFYSFLSCEKIVFIMRIAFYNEFPCDNLVVLKCFYIVSKNSLLTNNRSWNLALTFSVILDILFTEDFKLIVLNHLYS